MEQEYVVDIDHLTIRFNLASEKINDLKEYFVKLVKRELMFQEFLALQDVDLKVRRGESWGLIGVNGSGKSTLLKAACGILRPYKGSIQINGSIAPLIELGAGFDYNMTARENIFLNGTVLGHSRKFMQEHFDEIVDFAELHQFLDRPDILIVDEILSVGDYQFQQKCYQRMEEMLGGGTTLLYVSHDINSVKKLCDHAIWLEKGHVRKSGLVDDVCDEYMQVNR